MGTALTFVCLEVIAHMKDCCFFPPKVGMDGDHYLFYVCNISYIGFIIHFSSPHQITIFFKSPLWSISAVYSVVECWSSHVSFSKLVCAASHSPTPTQALLPYPGISKSRVFWLCKLYQDATNHIQEANNNVFLSCVFFNIMLWDMLPSQFFSFAFCF